MTDALVPKQRSTIYITPSLWEEFKTICGREDVSASEKVEGFIARYVAVHCVGNPQLLLRPFMDGVQGKCFNCEAMKVPLIRVKFISGLIAEVCSTCLRDKDAHGLVKHIYGAKAEESFNPNLSCAKPLRKPNE